MILRRRIPPPQFSPLSAAVSAPGARGEAVRAEVDSLEGEESHHGLVVVPGQEDRRSIINFHKLDILNEVPHRVGTITTQSLRRDPK